MLPTADSHCDPLNTAGNTANPFSTKFMGYEDATSRSDTDRLACSNSANGAIAWIAQQRRRPTPASGPVAPPPAHASVAGIRRGPQVIAYRQYYERQQLRLPLHSKISSKQFPACAGASGCLVCEGCGLESAPLRGDPQGTNLGGCGGGGGCSCTGGCG